jgi:hypothetical protein
MQGTARVNTPLGRVGVQVLDQERLPPIFCVVQNAASGASDKVPKKNESERRASGGEGGGGGGGQSCGHKGKHWLRTSCRGLAPERSPALRRGASTAARTTD